MQKSNMAIIASTRDIMFVNWPENISGARTNPFLIHCLGLMRLTRPTKIYLFSVEVEVQSTENIS